MFGMVLQDTWLNSGTIRENIRYGRPDATDEEVESSCKGGTHRSLHQAPSLRDMTWRSTKKQTNISQGSETAADHSQSAFWQMRRYMILDEATSSVDTRTEPLIQKAMANTDAGTGPASSSLIACLRSKDADHILSDEPRRYHRAGNP